VIKAPTGETRKFGFVTFVNKGVVCVCVCVYVVCVRVRVCVCRDKNGACTGESIQTLLY
jgi:hypothetical protein